MKYNNIKMEKFATRIVIPFIAILLVGCSAKVVRYVNPEANFSYIKRVAVLPFNNFSSDRFAGEKVRTAIMVELLSRGVFDVVEEGEVNKVVSMVLRTAGAVEGGVFEPDRETIKMLGERLGVQAVIVGSVEEYGGGREGVVSISARMIDTSSGIVLWQAKAYETSASAWRKILGIEELDRTVLTTKAVRRLLDTLL